MKKIWIVLVVVVVAVVLLSLIVWIKKGPSIERIEITESSGLVQETYPVHPKLKGKGAISFRPIGYFHSPYNEKTGAPRQGVLVKESQATLHIEKPYRKGLRDLIQFEYIIVFYWFDRTETWSPLVNPPKSKHLFGVFSTRSPKRPNPIGFSIVKLNCIDEENGILYLSGIDAFDGTPVLDIKPYLPSIDIIESSINTKTEKELGHHDEKYIKESTMYR